MPQYNGTSGRTFGQAYARNKGGKETDAAPKAKGGEEVDSEDGNDEKEKGDVVHVKHMGGGKYKTKHEDGHMEEHDSKSEMLSHLDEHYPEDEGKDESEQSMAEDEGLGDMGGSLKALLG